MTRARIANVEEFIKGKIIDNAVDQREQYTRIFYYGIVVNNNDPSKSNRLKIRIPVLDDLFYLNKTNEEGNEQLPWCSPISRNFICTPEQNTKVLVAVMDPKTPYWGRIYMDGITMKSKLDIFNKDRLTPESDTYEDWTNIEEHHNVILKNKPKNANEYNVADAVNYTMGIRGKGKNRVTLDKDNVSIYQNEGDTSKESLLTFTQNIKLEAADTMELLSKKGETNHYHPLFDKPVYDYINSMNSLIKDIIIVMNSTPSLCNINMAPNFPSPSAVKLIPTLAKLYVDFNKLKLPGQGASKKISIN